jgi:hypothetical protein
MGWDAVNLITDTMRKELGDDVVNTDHKAVSDWIEKWTAEWSAKKLRDMAKESSEQAKLDVEMLIEDRRAVDRLNLGQEWAWSRPKKPKAIKQSASQAERDAFEQAQKEYLQEAIEWDKQNRAIREKPISEKDIANLVAYTKSMKSRQAEFEAIAGLLGGISDQQVRLNEGRQVSGKLAEVRNNIREAELMGESTFFVNNGGFIIQQLMPKAEKPLLGLEVTGTTWISQQKGSLDIFGKRVLGKGDAGEIRGANYIIYGNGGNIIARKKTLEEAAEEVDKASRQAKWMKSFVAEGANLDVEVPESMKQPMPPASFPSKYNKPAPR